MITPNIPTAFFSDFLDSLQHQPPPFQPGKVSDVLEWLDVDKENQYRPLEAYNTPHEKMMLILNDGTSLLVGGGNENRINLPLQEIRQQLHKRGKGWADVATIVHSHLKGGPSAEDYNLDSLLRKLGFPGEFQIYYPKFRRARTVKQKK